MKDLSVREVVETVPTDGSTNAVQSNGVFDAIRAARPYKVYTARLDFAVSPGATIIENTLGGTPTFTRIASGHYRLTLTGAFPNGNKVFCSLKYQVFYSTSAEVSFYINAFVNDANSFDILTQDFALTLYDTDTTVDFELRVYF